MSRPEGPTLNCWHQPRQLVEPVQHNDELGTRGRSSPLSSPPCSSEEFSFDRALII
jgi:hypothetical protein